MRVIDVVVPPGETTLEHMHVHDFATVCVECAPTRSRPQNGEFGPVRPRAVGSVNVTEYTLTPAAHAVANLSDTENYHLLGVENLKVGQSKGGSARDLAVTQETTGFRIYEYVLGARERGPRHRHAGPGVSITTESRTWQIIEPNTAHMVGAGASATGIVEIELK
jgi:hypothetical protein